MLLRLPVFGGVGRVKVLLECAKFLCCLLTLPNDVLAIIDMIPIGVSGIIEIPGERLCLPEYRRPTGYP